MRTLLPVSFGLATFFALPGAPTQEAPLRSELRLSPVDSGVHRNATGRPLVVFETLVAAPGAPWMRLVVDTHALPGGSHLLAVSVRDGHGHRLDAGELARWRNHSAYLNGDMLLVRLVAGPRTEGVRFTTTHVEAGVVEPVLAPLSLCDGTDTRRPSTDPRVARVVPVGCTAWLISDTDCFISAGHCCSRTTFQTVQFNVPPSSSGGSINHPPPQDQYVVDRPGMAFEDAGVGRDWCVFKTLRNATTGRHAGEVQGAFFTLVTPPPLPNFIRITGHGRAPGTLNQTQQAAVGPMAATGNTVRYRTDTEPGNSGSPVILETPMASPAVGVHTHGGCTASGGSNAGTGYSHQPFQDAVARICGPQPGVADYRPFGQGCAGTAPGPCLALNSQGGTVVQQALSNEYAYAVRTSAPVVVTGFSLFTQTVSLASSTIQTGLYLATAAGVPESSPAATGTMTVGATAGWYPTTLNVPVTIPAGTLFFLAADSNTVYASSLTAGDNPPGPTYWRRPPFGTSAWAASAIINFPAWRIDCRNAGAQPALSATGLPRLGSGFAVDLEGALPNATAALLTGVSDSAWGALRLPMDLGGLGAPWCFLQASGDLILPAAVSAAGTAQVRFAVPNDPALSRGVFFNQYVVADPTANALGLVVSNGGRGTVGL